MATVSKYRVVILAYLGFIIIAMPETGLGVAWPSMQRTFGVQLDALGALLILSRVGLVAASFGSGRLTSRFGQGNVLVVGSAVRTVALLGYALAPSWPMLLLTSTVAGLGGGVLTPGFNSYFAVNHGPRLMNWLHASFGVGALLGPAMMTAIISQGHSWRWGYVIAAGLQLLLTAGFALTRHGWDGTPAEVGTPSHGPELPAGARLRALLLLSMALFFVSAGLESTTGQWSFTLFAEGRGAAVATAGFWVSAYWLSFTLTRIGFGFIADKLPSTGVLRTSIWLAAAAALLLSVNVTPATSYLALVVMGIALAPMAPLLTSTTADRLGPAQAVRGVGFQVAAAGMGIAFVPAFAGVLAERIHIEALGPFLIVLCLVLAALLELTNVLVRRRVLPAAHGP